MFNIEDMAQRLEMQAPLLWSLVGYLLSSDPSFNKQKAKYSNITEHNGDVLWEKEDVAFELGGTKPTFF